MGAGDHTLDQKQKGRGNVKKTAEKGGGRRRGLQSGWKKRNTIERSKNTKRRKWEGGRAGDFRLGHVPGCQVASQGISSR